MLNIRAWTEHPGLESVPRSPAHQANAERPDLESVPRAPAHHSLIREVRDGVDALPSDIGQGLMREREEQ